MKTSAASTNTVAAAKVNKELGPPSRTARRIRVLLAEDHDVLRDCLSQMLQQYNDVEIAGLAEDGQAAVRLARQLKPDVVLLDMRMPQLDGVEAAHLILHENAAVRIIGLSMHDEVEQAEAMLKAGAVAYLSKDAPIQHLVDTIRQCAAASA